MRVLIQGNVVIHVLKMSEELPLTEQDQILADVTAARRILSSKDVEPSRLTIGNVCKHTQIAAVTLYLSYTFYYDHGNGNLVCFHHQDEGVRSLPHVAAFQGNDTLLKCLIDEFGVDPELADKVCGSSCPFSRETKE